MAPGIRGFIWIELANLRAGQPLLATLHPTILFHPYALMMVATWPLWLVQSIVRPLNFNLTVSLKVRGDRILRQLAAV